MVGELLFVAVIDAERDDLPECGECTNRASILRIVAWGDSRRTIESCCLIHSGLGRKDRKRIKRMIAARRGNHAG